MSSPLKDTSYVVLGMVESCEPATPYDLKQMAEISVFNFWSIPHTQVYTECSRLAESGYLSEMREEGGRRRKVYRLTAAGRKELDAWRNGSSFEFKPLELRDPGMIRLFFGADPAPLAEHQIEGHRETLAMYERVREHFPEMPDGMRLALECGIGAERQFIRFWSKVAAESDSAEAQG